MKQCQFSLLLLSLLSLSLVVVVVAVVVVYSMRIYIPVKSAGLHYVDSSSDLWFLPSSRFPVNKDLSKGTNYNLYHRQFHHQYHYYSLWVYHTNVSWWSFIGSWVTASPIKSPRHLEFRPTTTMLQSVGSWHDIRFPSLPISLSSVWRPFWMHQLLLVYSDFHV